MKTKRFVRTSCLGLLLLAAAAGCATGGSQRADDDEDRDVITAEDLARQPGQDLFTVIERLRPQWLRSRERTFVSETVVGVFVDGVRRADGVEILRGMRVVTVQEVRYMNARDATTMYGPDLAGGAILVTTKRGR